MWLRTNDIKWANRFSFTIQADKINKELTDFPLMLNLSTSSGLNSKNLRNVFDVIRRDSNQKKIAITYGRDQCFAEIQEWDNVNRKAIIWVKCPVISNLENTEFYFYYDRHKDDNDTYVGTIGSSAAQSIWDSDYIGVWHMCQAPSGGPNCILDSTSNILNGSPSGAIISAGLVEGKIGHSINFNGLNDVINFGKDSILNDITEKTFEITGIPSSWGEIGYGRLYDKNRNYLQLSYAGSRIRYIQHYGEEDLIEFYAENDKIETDGAFSVSMKFNNTEPDNYPKLFVNGEDQAVIRDFSSSDTRADDSPYDFLIGNRNDGSRAYKGIIDEVRLSKIIRSNAWLIASEFSNLDELLEFDEVVEGMDYFSAWDYYRKLEIDRARIEEDLVDFPVRISLSTSSGITSRDLSNFFDEMGELDNKRFTITDANFNQLYVEIEVWDIINKSIELWVKVPSVLKNLDTVLYMFYDNDHDENNTYVGTINSSAAEEVWDDNFICVYHFEELTGELKDSTSNHLHSIINNVWEGYRDNSGPIGNAYRFTGAEYITLPNSLLLCPENISIECLCFVDSGNPDWARIIDRLWNPNYGYALGVHENSKMYMEVDFSGMIKAAFSPTVIEGDGFWHNYGGSYNNRLSENALYLSTDGIIKSDNIGPNPIIPHYEWMHTIIGYGWFHNIFFKGEICEIRLSNIPRTNAWLKATHWSNTDDLITYYPTADTYSITGQINKYNKPTSACIRMYRRSDGSFQDEIYSDPISGVYLIDQIRYTDEYCTLVAFNGNKLNALVRDKVLPESG